MSRKQLLLIMILTLTAITITTVLFAMEGKENFSSMLNNEATTMQKEAVPATKIKQLKQILTSQNLIELLKKQGYYEDEINKYMSRFIKIATIYNLSNDEIEKVYSLMNDGYDLWKIIDVFEFSMDTDRPRDFDFIQSVYDRANKLKLDEKHWVETAFNSLTNDRSGILNESEIKSYIDKGITLQEVSIANVMSRNGQKTIQQILDEKLKGKEWADIAQEVYVKKNLSAQAYSHIKEVDKIYAHVVMSEISGININQVPINGQSADEKLAEKNHIAAEVMDELNISEEITESVLGVANEKLSDVDEESVKHLLEKGYSIREMEEGIKHATEKNLTLEEYLE